MLPYIADVGENFAAYAEKMSQEYSVLRIIYTFLLKEMSQEYSVFRIIYTFLLKEMSQKLENNSYIFPNVSF